MWSFDEQGQIVLRERPRFNVLAKPVGAICNLGCTYCYYLAKKDLYPGDRFRMTKEVMRAYVRQMIVGQPGEVTLAWQGGEPTLMGLNFFEEVIEEIERYRSPRQRVVQTLQTNATLLNEEWAAFLARNDFLVGVSVDGPPDLHDVYRRDKRDRPTSARVLAGLAHLRRHGVRHNLLCTVNAANAIQPARVYRYLRDDCGAEFIQFIPVVERTLDQTKPESVSAATVRPDAWGRFLCDVFDEWLSADVGSVFVQGFDATLASWVGVPPGLCVFAETCGEGLALEHNGDVYSCDHFVDPGHLLGNITEVDLVDLVSSTRQRRFGAAKRDGLPGFCRRCDVRFACNGECPKNRFVTTPEGEPGLNYLCAGYKEFFHHAAGPMRIMADFVRSGRPAAGVIEQLARGPRNAPCLCGSGLKTKLCHGRLHA